MCIDTNYHQSVRKKCKHMNFSLFVRNVIKNKRYVSKTTWVRSTIDIYMHLHINIQFLIVLLYYNTQTQIIRILVFSVTADNNPTSHPFSGIYYTYNVGGLPLDSYEWPYAYLFYTGFWILWWSCCRIPFVYCEVWDERWLNKCST